MTSEAEFPEEQQVPPVILNTPELPIGSIIGSDQRRENGVRLAISVSDENLDDTLQVQAEVSVVGQPMTQRICPMAQINASEATAVREQFTLVIDRLQIRPGACNRVDVYVSRKFAGNCTDRPRGFAVPQQDENDLATALFWIWETSGDPVTSDQAAQDITNTCLIVQRAATTSMPMAE